MAKRTARLNAISKSYTEKYRKEAIKELKETYDVDYEKWCKRFSYKASPRTLLRCLNSQTSKVMYNYKIYKEES